MEVQENNMRTQISKKQLEANYKMAINKIWDICDHNDYNLKVTNNKGLDAIYSIDTDFSNLSRNASKNIAKRLYHFNMKNSRRTMNILFLVLKKLGVITENVKINISNKEKEINRLRDIYKIMKLKAEDARLAYKKEKGNFYKEKLAQ